MEKDSCGGKKDNFVLICKAGVRGRSPWGARKISLGMYGPVGEKKKNSRKNISICLCFSKIFQNFEFSNRKLKKSKKSKKWILPWSQS